ncbi:MAG: TIGR03619 family F420-dependent LLM class oxidoreductase [Gammaproteobacteria bacterium]|nr:TIGR03619 family F420-dependent LLM class oxidoreductase [Gammaproteobacteria bacterium]
MERPEFGVLYSRFFPIVLPGEFASTAQALGFDSVWVSDGPSSRRAALDPVVCMASMAHCADRIRIGSSVILVPIRNPAILAKEIASLDVVSGGRIVFGIGVGVSGMSDRGAYRATSTDPRERGARCDEYLEVMTTLWTGSADRYRGRFFEFDDIEMSPRPVQRPHPPIWAGGDAHGMLRRTARACQGFVPVATGPERYAERWRHIERYAAQLGRDPLDITRALHLYYRGADTRTEARALAERSLSERSGRDVEVIDDGRFALGDAEACAETIAAYREVGVEHFVINLACPASDVPAQVERFAHDVLPRFR